MSLLPQQILPENEPIGQVQAGGQVLLSHNWYLLLYNLCALVLGGPASIPATQAFPVTVGPSPFSYAAPEDGDLAAVGGLVSKITLTRYGITVQVGITAQLFPVRQGDVVTVTYSEVPSLTFFPS